MAGRPGHGEEVSFVDVDNVEGSHTAASHLIRLGYRRIATITGPLNTPVGLDRRQGYLNALTERGRPVDESLLVEGDFTEVGGYVAMQRLLVQRPPEAIFVASDTMALGALRALRNAGLSVPKDVAVVGFDDLPSSSVSDPPLTTIRQPIARIGSQAVRTLLDILENGLQTPRQIIMTTQLVIRNSCGSSLRSEEV
jgi:LacI family transcriptional regulator